MASVYVIMGAVSTPALHAPTWITRDELEVSYSYGGTNSGIEPVWVEPRTLGGVKRVDVMQQLSLGDTSHENKAERKIIAFFLNNFIISISYIIENFSPTLSSFFNSSDVCFSLRVYKSTHLVFKYIFDLFLCMIAFVGFRFIAQEQGDWVIQPMFGKCYILYRAEAGHLIWKLHSC